MSLSLRVSGAPDVSIHGPSNIMDIYEATKSFITFEDFDITGFTRDDHLFEDNAVTVRHVKLESSQQPVCAPQTLYSTWQPGKIIKLKRILFSFTMK
jgi:hypothetical protein